MCRKALHRHRAQYAAALLGDGKAEVLLLHNGKGKPLVLVNWDTWNRVTRTVVNGEFPDEPQQSGYNHSVIANAP